MTYIRLNEKYLEENKQKAKETSLSWDKENKDMLLFDEAIKETVTIGEITEGGILCLDSDSDLGFISLSIQLDNDNLMTIANIIVKRMNKFKSVLESLK